MSEYHPDRWVLVKFTPKQKDSYYKVFGSWKGGYLDGDSWRMNSGISRIVRKKNRTVEFDGFSGSKYICGNGAYGTTVYGAGVLDSILKNGNELNIEVTVLTEKEALELKL